MAQQPQVRDHLDRKLTCLQHAALYHFNIRVVCPSCRRVRIFQGHQLWWLFERRRWNDRLEEVPRRLSCSRCWVADHRKVRPIRVSLVKDLPTGDELPWPDERAWKRVVSRYRS
ncbi:hypothetical protein SAMN06295912_1598 [Sphingomonas laterariae]|uniref:Uncharacterized protein n=1 Tax=Edaphosphingomonas laterariae TaxID=861865 RepID=A0A239KTQ5_9SPHN|nr:hypothetical protein [Sphingomonas laterariae]SNT20889.1 hypothetical protein SAMN06295912_1598 [Sphingomonas laterariae]